MKASLTLQRNVYAKRDIWAVKKMSFTGKYIAKMFSLKRSFWQMNVFSNWFVFVRDVGNQGYVSRKVYLLKNL